MGSSAGMSKAHACGTPRDGQPDPSFYPTGIERFQLRNVQSKE